MTTTNDGRGDASPGADVKVTLCDLGGDAPRIELHVGGQLIGHQQLARRDVKRDLN